MENILVTAIGSFSAHVVINSLKKMGYGVVGCDIYPKEWIVNAVDVDKFYQAPYASAESEYIDFVTGICAKNSIKRIIPLTDLEVDVLNQYRFLFSEKGIQICMSEKSVIYTCRDKYNLINYINNNTSIVNTIPTWRLQEIKSQDIQLPVVCKIYNGRSSQGLKYIKDVSEWQAFLNTDNIENYIIQPYIEGSVVTVDVVRDLYGNCVAIPRKELLRTLNGAGTSVYVFRDMALESISVELASLLNVIGCINFEYILDKKGAYHFLECNPRFSGGVVFSCLAGYNCVENHIRAFLNETIDEFELNGNYYIARRYESQVLRIED